MHTGVVVALGARARNALSSLGGLNQDLSDLPPAGLPPLEGGQRQPTDRPRAVESNTSNEN